MPINQVAPHLERLRRHHESASRTYDHVSFLDLSHALRIWVDLKQALPKAFPKFATTLSFKTASPPKKILNHVRGCQYVFSYMPGSVITHACHGELLGVPPIGEKYSAGIRVRGLGTDSVEMGRFCVVAKLLDEPMRKVLEGETVTRCNYVQWLSSDAVRMCYLNSLNQMTALSLSREILIKRVANTLDGSHPSLATAGETDNKFDGPIHHLLKFQWGGVPLPYLVLLKIAQDILEVAPRLIFGDENA